MICDLTDILYSMTHDEKFLLQRVQPAMVGLIDGSLSTLAPARAAAQTAEAR